jgi:hypothetical protein
VKQIVFLFVCLASVVTSLPAQTVDATVCDILSNPQSFDGKIVRVKGTVIAGFEEFAIKDASCRQAVNAIWLAYPEGTKGKAGPAAVLQLQLAKNSTGSDVAPSRAAVQLEKSKEFKQFDSLLAAQYQGSGMCLGCGKNIVSATLVGRLDGTKTTGVTRDSAGKFVTVSGFGNLNMYTARLVLQSVSDVASHAIDYSKAAALTKNDSGQASAGGDPVAAAHQAARAFGANSSAGAQIEQAAAAFGKQGEDNGVNVGFGVANEVQKGDGRKGDGNSPDGLLFNCMFSMDRLKGDALAKAIVHMGAHIADIRGDKPSMKPVDAEYGAWETTVLSSIATGQKTLTLPGGYVVWSTAWAPSDRNKMVGDAITSYLASWSAFGK